MGKKKVTKKDASSSAALKSAGGSAWFEVLKDYLEGVKIEFNKVTWSNKNETIGLTVAVLIISFFFASYLGLVDFTLTQLLNLLY